MLWGEWGRTSPTSKNRTSTQLHFVSARDRCDPVAPLTLACHGRVLAHPSDAAPHVMTTTLHSARFHYFTVHCRLGRSGTAAPPPPHLSQGPETACCCCFAPQHAQVPLLALPSSLRREASRLRQCGVEAPACSHRGASEHRRQCRHLPVRSLQRGCCDVLCRASLEGREGMDTICTAAEEEIGESGGIYTPAEWRRCSRQISGVASAASLRFLVECACMRSGSRTPPALLRVE